MSWSCMDAFQVFFESKEECLGTFLRTFVELSAAERALFLFGGGASESSSADADLFAASIRAFSGAAGSGGRSSWESPRVVTGRTLPSAGAGGEEEGVEEVVVDEAAALRTGAMTLFLNEGVTDIMPSFDNFVLEGGGAGEGDENGNTFYGNGCEVVDGKETVNGETSPLLSIQTARIRIEFTDADNEVNAVDLAEVLASVQREVGVDSDSDTDIDIELPGLLCDLESQERYSGPPGRSAVFFSPEDLEMLEKNNDEVRQFVLDPCFDYDADIVGRSARMYPRQRM